MPSRLPIKRWRRRSCRAVLAFVMEGATVDDLPLDLRGTQFQLRVWKAIRALPRGATTSYGASLKPSACRGPPRTVGTACGANPVSLLVPCHRVVRSGGGLGGYEWGLDRKRTLLELEAGGTLRLG